MDPALPPTAVTRPAVTFVGVTFMFGPPTAALEYVRGRELDPEVRGPRGAMRNRLCTPKCQRFSPGLQSRRGPPSRIVRSAAANAVMSYHAIDGLVGEIRIAELIRTDRDDRPRRRRREARAGRIGNRDRRREIAAGLLIGDERKLPAAERRSTARERWRATALAARTEVGTSAALVTRCVAWPRRGRARAPGRTGSRSASCKCRRSRSVSLAAVYAT